MDECIFCKIAKNELPSYRIYENGNFIALLDIFPYSKGHVMVIPKEHYRQVWDLPEELYREYTEVVRKVALSMKEKSGSDHVYSAIFGNLVDHAHIHVIPSYGRTFTDILENRTGEKIDEKLATEMQTLFKME